MLDDLGDVPTPELFDLVPQVAASYGAEDAMTNLLWELGTRGLLDEQSIAWVDGPLYAELLERVRRYQRAGLNKDGFDANGIWQGWNTQM